MSELDDTFFSIVSGLDLSEGATAVPVSPTLTEVIGEIGDTLHDRLGVIATGNGLVIGDGPPATSRDDVPAVFKLVVSGISLGLSVGPRRDGPPQIHSDSGLQHLFEENLVKQGNDRQWDETVRRVIRSIAAREIVWDDFLGWIAVLNHCRLNLLAVLPSNRGFDTGDNPPTEAQEPVITFAEMAMHQLEVMLTSMIVLHDAHQNGG